MGLFFDAHWFDAKLEEKGLDRNALADALKLDHAGLHLVYLNERALTGAELQAFADLVGADLVEASLRAGVATRPTGEDAAARLDDMEARLNAIDSWLAELEAERKSA